MGEVFASASDPGLSDPDWFARFAAGMGFPPPTSWDDALSVNTARLRRLAPPWGVGLETRPLVPFSPPAVDRRVIPIGTSLYVEELDGTRLPGLMLAFHDGCVVADDTGDRMTGNRIDWFVGRQEAYAALDARLHLTKITVHDGGERCPQPTRPTEPN